MAMSFGSALMGSHASGEQFKLQKDQEAWQKTQADLKDKADKKSEGKSLWSSLGGKIGAIGGGALGTGALTAMLLPIAGPAAPALAAAMSAGIGSYAGRKLGEQGYSAQGKGTLTKGGFGLDKSEVTGMPISQGKFHSDKRSALKAGIGRDVSDIKGDMDTSNRNLHQQQIMASLTDAGTAGALKGGGDWMGDLFGGAPVDYSGTTEAIEGIDFRHGGLI